MDPEIRVFLAGAGPGDPELITLKLQRLLGQAEIVLHDSLTGPAILALARPGAELIDVGKRCGGKAMKQADICALLVASARSGKIVLRLKGGDPMIFGRATEEMAALRAAGIGFAIIPGITAAAAAAAALQISLTQRERSRALHLLAAHGADGGLPPHDFAALAHTGGTFAVYMGTKTIASLAAALIAAGLSPSLPAVALENVSLPDERIWRATLATLPDKLAEAAPAGPVLLLIGAAMGACG